MNFRLIPDTIFLLLKECIKLRLRANCKNKSYGIKYCVCIYKLTEYYSIYDLKNLKWSSLSTSDQLGNISAQCGVRISNLGISWDASNSPPALARCKPSSLTYSFQFYKKNKCFSYSSNFQSLRLKEQETNLLNLQRDTVLNFFFPLFVVLHNQADPRILKVLWACCWSCGTLLSISFIIFD